MLFLSICHWTWIHNCSYLIFFFPGTGIKINQVDTLTSRGYDRLRISSRAIEAYLIQVSTLFLSESVSNIWCWIYSSDRFIAIFLLIFVCVTDIENRFLSRWSTSWKSCYWCWWINYLLRLWHDGGDKIFHPWEIARTVLFRLWEGCQKGLVSFIFAILAIFKASKIILANNYNLISLDCW